MALTPVLGLDKPDIGADQDSWGALLNDDLDIIDANAGAVNTALAGKAPTVHTHTISQVTNLQTSLDAKFDKAGGTITGIVNVSNADPTVQIHKPGLGQWLFKMGTNVEVGVYNGAAWAWYYDGAAFSTPGNVVAYWSDRRLKEAILPIEGYEARIMGLRPVSFQWNAKGQELTGKAEGEREVGFIAQEARDIDNRYVAVNPSAPVAEYEDPYLTVKKDEMIADLVAMVQTLNTRLRKLESMLA